MAELYFQTASRIFNFPCFLVEEIDNDFSKMRYYGRTTNDSSNLGQVIPSNNVWLSGHEYIYD